MEKLNKLFGIIILSCYLFIDCSLEEDSKQKVDRYVQVSVSREKSPCVSMCEERYYKNEIPKCKKYFRTSDLRQECINANRVSRYECRIRCNPK